MLLTIGAFHNKPEVLKYIAMAMCTSVPMLMAHYRKIG